jgi:hypothetical protein
MQSIILKTINYFLCLLIVLAFTSCDSDKSVHVKDNPGIVPLISGALWLYTDSSASVDYSTTSKIEITGTKTINYNGKKIDVYLWNLNSGADTWYFRNEEDGLYCYGYNNGTKDTIFRNLHVKFPAVSGDEFIRNSVYADGTGFTCDEYTVKLISISKTLKTNNNQYTCYDYRYYKQDSSYIDEYYNPFTGYLGSETFDKNGDLQFRKILYHADLN